MSSFVSRRAVCAAVPLCLCLASEAVGQTSEPVTAPEEGPLALPVTRIEADRITQTTAGPVDGYRALTATSATRTDTPIEQIPQSIQVIDRRVIEDQDAQTITDAVQNVSGVRGITPKEINNASFIIRGFDADTYVDGFQLFQTQTQLESLANVERIEVVKGPTASLFGGSAGAPVGGIINVISKQPTGQASQEVGIRGGSYETIGGFFDVNQPLAPQHGVLFRITGESQRSDDYVDRVDSWQYSFFPSLTVAAGEDTTLTFRGRFSDRQTDDYSGLPAFGTVDGDYDVRRQRFIGADNTPNTQVRNGSAQVDLQHRFNDIFKANLGFRYLNSNFDQYSVWPYNFATFDLVQPLLAVPLPGTLATVPLATGRLNQEIEAFSVAPTLTATFDLGPVENTLLFGFDYDRTTDDGYIDASFFGGTLDLSDPDYPEFVTPDTRFTDQRNRYETEAVYLQEQATLWKRLHVLAGGRFTNISIDSKQRPNAFSAESTSLNDDKSKFTPRVGAVVDIIEELSVFAGYGEGFQAPAGNIGLASPKPEESQQVEAGLRFNLPTDLTGSIAVYQLERDNVPTSGPGTLGTVQTGKQRSRGVELDAIWQPLPGLSLIGNYAYTDAEVVSDESIPEGNRLPRVPEHSGRLAGNYRFQDELLEGLSIGAGITAASSREVDFDNNYQTDAYYTIDTNIAYRYGPLVARFTVLNLTDTEYWEPYQFFGGTIAPNNGRSFYLTVAAKF